VFDEHPASSTNQKHGWTHEASLDVGHHLLSIKTREGNSSSIDVLPNGPRLSCGALKKTHPIIYARLLKRLLAALGWTKTVQGYSILLGVGVRLLQRRAH